MPPSEVEYIVSVLVPYGGKVSRIAAESIARKELEDTASELSLQYRGISLWKRRDYNEITGTIHGKYKKP